MYLSSPWQSALTEGCPSRRHRGIEKAVHISYTVKARTVYPSYNQSMVSPNLTQLTTLTKVQLSGVVLIERRWRTPTPEN